MSDKKRAVITILGIQGGKVEDGKATIFNKEHLAEYYFEDSSEKKEEYFNTLPILYKKYGKDYKIIPLYTDDSKIFNEKVISDIHPEVDIEFKKEYHIKNEKDFNATFRLFNTIIEEMDEVIIDVTHGFRHLPLLMLIDLMIINFKDIDKIKHIYFAKEIKKHTPVQKGEYEIIDLKEYLDLANMSYLLSSFESNYTISNSIKTSNEDYNRLINELSKFSQHILANSIDALVLTTKEKKSISDKIIEYIDDILDDKSDDNILLNYKRFLLKLKEHISEIKSYGELQEYKKFYYIATQMQHKGYLLNSITLLSEAIGLYCKEQFKQINSDVKDFIENFEDKVKEYKDSNKKYGLYSLSNQSKTLYKLGYKFKGIYLEMEETDESEKNHNKKSKKITKDIKKYISSIRNTKEYKDIQDLIYSIDNLRNNLAHGNSSKRLDDVRRDIEANLSKFREYCL